jgi:glutamate synthase (NADPH/NADH) large chain
MNLETLVTAPVTVEHWEQELKGLIEAHVRETGSRKAAEILQHWDLELRNFVQVCPKEMLNKLAHPISTDEAAIPAE